MVRSLFYIFVTFFSAACFADSTLALSNNRPKTCLVLSGGGALGIAHVGVLKVLEEQRIPIDCITGTSMGSIIGGLYASGYTADELEALVMSSQWIDLFKDNAPRSEKSYQRKQDDRNFLVKYRLRVSDEGDPMLPRGFITGNKIDLSFLEFTLRSRNIEHFDDLPIPFRAIAADVETGDEVILDKGSLSKAMKASMSIPGVFPPMMIDGRPLVDGGIVNNMPIDVARSMGAEVVIVVGIPAELKKNAELKSALDIAGQVTSLLIKKNEDAQLVTLKSSDILIVPDIKGYSAASFDKAKELVEPGYEAASKHIAALQRYRLSDASYAAFRKQQIVPEPAKPVLSFVEIDNQSGVNDSLIRSRLNTQAGDSLDMALLNQDLVRLSGTGYFDEVLFDVVEKNGKSGVVITAFGPSAGNKDLSSEQVDRASTTSRNNVQFGLSLEDDFQGDSNYNLGMRYKRIPINESGAEFNADMQVGDQSKIQASMFQPLDDEARYFIEPFIGYDARNIPVFADGVQDARYRLHRSGAGFDIGRQFGNVAELRAGLLRGIGYADLRDGDPVLGGGDFELGHYYISAQYDTLDSLSFPRHGVLVNVSFLESLDALGASAEFQNVEGQIVWAETWNANTLVLSAGTKLNLEDDAPIQGRFTLGGFGNLSGYRRNELLASNYTLYRASVYREWNEDKNALFQVPFYTGMSLEAAGLFDSKNDLSFNLDDHILAGSVFVGTETVMGPVYLGYGQAEGGQQSVYLFLGRTF